MKDDKIAYSDLDAAPLEKQLREDIERTERSAWLKVYFLQNMSHELRNPLMAICGFADFIADLHSDGTNPDTMRLVERISVNSHALLNKIQGLLSTTRLECLKRQQDEAEGRATNSYMPPAGASTEELFVALNRARDHETERTELIDEISQQVHSHIDAIVDLAHRLAHEQSSSSSPEDTSMVIHLIEENSQVLLTLVDDIRDWGLLQSGLYRTRRTQLDPVVVCQICMKSIQHKVSAGVELRFESSLPEGLRLNTDNVRLQQIIRNMLSNAIKYTTEGSITLSVRLVGEGLQVEFAVADTGTGINPANAEIIFHRFEKLNSFKKGSGLGLHICRLIAARLGGEIHLDTDYTKGARFVFTHPLVSE